jgi:hypothetical protein
MSGTFTTLVKNADFAGVPSGGGGSEEDNDDEADDEQDEQRRERRRDRGRDGKTRIGDLVYSVNIVLPESRDPAVYDALFKALREHLG